MSQSSQPGITQATYLLIAAGVAAFTLAPAILFIEVYEWLTSSEWPGLTIADGLALFGLHHAEPESEAQRLIDVAMAVPLSIALFFAGVSSFLLGVSLGDWRDERRLIEELRDAPAIYWIALFGASDVSGATLVRLLLLDVLLRLVTIAGTVFVVAEGVLLLVGSPVGWLCGTGIALILAASLARRTRFRKLGGVGQSSH